MAFLTFRVANQWYGVDVDDVIEVMHFVALDELPLSEPDILGLMTLRDKVITVLDLRHRFGAADVTLSLDTPIIALQTDKHILGIVVDDVDDVEYITTFSEYTGAPSETSRYIKQVAHLEERLIMLLDVNKL